MGYTGDVIVTVKMCYLVDAPNADAAPTNEQMLEILRNHKYSDIVDEETLEVLSVEEVRENLNDEDEEDE